MKLTFILNSEYLRIFNVYNSFVTSNILVNDDSINKQINKQINYITIISIYVFLFFRRG